VTPLRAEPFLPTASTLAAAAECVAPWSLGLAEEERESEAATWGRLCHAGAEALARPTAGMPRTAAVAAVGTVNGTWADVDKLDRVLRQVEVVLAADEGARLMVEAVDSDIGGSWPKVWLVEQGVQWRPSFPDGEARLVQRTPGERARGWFSGTADLVYMRADGVLVVVDWKFGWLTKRDGDPAQYHAQLWFLALALATAFGLDLSDPRRIVARVEARHVDEEGVEVDGADITAGDLLAFGDELAKLEQRIRAGEAPRIGQACGKCKAQTACPAWASLEAQATERIGSALPPSLLRDVPKTHEEAAMAWRAVQALEGAAPIVRRNLEAHVRTAGPVDLGMGLELQAKVTKGRDEALDTPEAHAKAAEVLGVEPAAFTVPTTSKGRMVKAWADAMGKKTSSADARVKVKQLREAGVLVEGAPSVRLEVRRSEGDEEVEP